MFSKIGLIGAPRSGKSLIGKYFVKEREFRALAFADLIKKIFFLIRNILKMILRKLKNLILFWKSKYEKNYGNIVMRKERSLEIYIL